MVGEGAPTSTKAPVKGWCKALLLVDAHFPGCSMGGWGRPSPCHTAAKTLPPFPGLPRACMVLPWGSRAWAYLYPHGNTSAGRATPLRSTTASR